MAGMDTAFKFLPFACLLQGVPLPASVLLKRIKNTSNLPLIVSLHVLSGRILSFMIFIGVKWD